LPFFHVPLVSEHALQFLSKQGSETRIDVQLQIHVFDQVGDHLVAMLSVGKRKIRTFARNVNFPSFPDVIVESLSRIGFHTRKKFLKVGAIQQAIGKRKFVFQKPV
jgi:hypothetical protein